MFVLLTMSEKVRSELDKNLFWTDFFGSMLIVGEGELEPHFTINIEFF